ncbi:MAG: dihydroneopterin aldolase [Bacteroides sp.]|nr:dihydroneopterin aldolase [Bacteroides sp.]
MKATQMYLLLEGVKIYAYHGVLPQENTVGSYYYINLKLKTNFETAAQTDNLKDTISYADIYTKVQEEMKIPSKLLEHVCERIALRLFNDFPSIEELGIELYKENPPMNACADKIGVSVHYSK